MAIDWRAVRQFYDRIAGPYDRLASAPIVRRWRQRFVNTLDLQSGDVVVDIGCGTGANIPVLREHVGERGRVIGIDLAPGMLVKARRRVERARWRNVDLIRADAREPPIAGNIDVVVGTFVIGLFDDPIAVIDRWCDQLGSGGRIGLLDATLSDRPVGRPLNLPFRVFTRLAAPSSRGDLASPATTLARQVRQTHDHVLERTTEPTSMRHALGLIRQSSGTIQ